MTSLAVCVGTGEVGCQLGQVCEPQRWSKLTGQCFCDLAEVQVCHQQPTPACSPSSSGSLLLAAGTLGGFVGRKLCMLWPLARSRSGIPDPSLLTVSV